MSITQIVVNTDDNVCIGMFYSNNVLTVSSDDLPIVCAVQNSVLRVTRQPPTYDNGGKWGVHKPRRGFCQWLCGKKYHPYERGKTIWKFSCPVNINSIVTFGFGITDLYIESCMDTKNLSISAHDDATLGIAFTTIERTKLVADDNAMVIIDGDCNAITVDTFDNSSVVFENVDCKEMTIHTRDESSVEGFNALNRLEIIAVHKSTVRGKKSEMIEDFGRTSLGTSSIDIVTTEYKKL